MKTELTLAVPTDYVWQVLDYQENAVIKALDSQVMQQLLSHGIFEHRNLLEDDPGFKQIIPYAVICCGDEVYLFRRTSKQTESRLHNLLSLGVGGHMNPLSDHPIDIDYLHHELEREMREEVLLHEDCRVESMTPVGFINDDTNEVGKVHLGVLYNIVLSNKHIEINEKEKMTGTWIPKANLHEHYEHMESWSQLYCNLLI